jgi:DNA-nicking Smr family endonuclease
MGRRLAPEEKALWGRVMATVKPIHGGKPIEVIAETAHPRESKGPSPDKLVTQNPIVKLKMQVMDSRLRGNDETKIIGQDLDSHWDRRFQKGAIIPDISIDLHGQGLASAYARLDRTLEHAIHQKLRVILLVTGHQRSHDRASGRGRGAIAAVVRDWLSASRHARHIAAVRPAHPRHGGAGAMYIVLRR